MLLFVIVLFIKEGEKERDSKTEQNTRRMSPLHIVQNVHLKEPHALFVLKTNTDRKIDVAIFRRSKNKYIRSGKCENDSMIILF